MVGDDRTGRVGIGGEHPVSVQTMTSGFTWDIDDCVAEINRMHEAGADIVETNTFGSTRISQGDYQMEALAREQNVEAARPAVRAAARDDPLFARRWRRCLLAGFAGEAARLAARNEIIAVVYSVQPRSPR